MDLKEKFTRICPQCNELIYHNRKKDRNFFEKKGTICKKCHLKNTAKPKEKFNCLTCDKEFWEWRSQLANPDMPFCSKKCWYNSGLKSLVDKRFGKLIVTERYRQNNVTYYKCQCDCGNNTTATHTNLISGGTESCGCLIKETRGSERKPIKDVISRAVWTSYKRNAKNRNYEWKLDYKYFCEIIFQNCYYCDSEPSNNFKWRYKHEIVHLLVNGVDRIDNTIGYIKENCVPCCRTCNIAKGEMSLTNFKKWADKLSINLKEIF